jgi:hypothetical protein
MGWRSRVTKSGYSFTPVKRNELGALRRLNPSGHLAG